MSVAYLIIAHEPDARLHLLVERLLADPRASVHLHLDRRTKDVGWLADQPRSRLFLRRDHAVNWASYSVAQAMLSVLHSAIDNPLNSRFVLLSGSCFPLLAPGMLEDAILTSPPQFAVWGRLDDENMIDHYGQRALTKYYPYGISWLNPKRSNFNRLMWRLLRPINHQLPYRRKLPTQSLWKGSMFFLADRHVVGAIFETAATLEPFLRHSHAPDEVLFNTAYANDCMSGYLEPRLTPIDADRQGTHFIRKRQVKRTRLQRLLGTAEDRELRTSDIDDAMESGALFARKCSLAIANEIIARIDA